MGHLTGDRLRLFLIGIITASVCGLMIYASFFQLVDLSPRSVALIEHATGIR